MSSREVRHFVYLAETTTKLKVGLTKDLKGRMKSLSDGCGEEVSLVGTHLYPSWWSARRAEMEIHARCAEWRLLGEWFLREPRVEALFFDRPNIAETVPILKAPRRSERFLNGEPIDASIDPLEVVRELAKLPGRGKRL